MPNAEFVTDPHRRTEIPKGRRMRLRKVATAMVAVGSILAVSACGGGESGGGEGDSFSIGVSQLVQHPALDAATEGFKKSFEDAGVDVEWDVQNAQGEQANATSIAQQFASDDLDLVLAVATPAAQAAAQAISDKPVLFTAVTDAEEAGLVDSNDKPGGNVTGTSDLNPVEEQLKLVKDVKPDAKTVGIVYSSGEVNSQVQVDLAKKAAKDLDVKIKEATIALRQWTRSARSTPTTCPPTTTWSRQCRRWSRRQRRTRLCSSGRKPAKSNPVRRSPAASTTRSSANRPAQWP